MLVATALLADAAPLARNVRGSGRIVWQQRYDGIAHVAYRGGKAIAGVSGPWSDRYVLIWWDRPLAPNPLELFLTLDEAMCAVERHAGQAVAELRTPLAPPRRRGWLGAWWPRRRAARDTLDRRRRQLDDELDLSGLNFSASR
jgi:hypothetical protein